MSAVPLHEAVANTFAKIDLSVLADGRSAPPPCPVNFLGSAAHWVLSAAEAACAPVDYVVAAILATASGAIGNARWVRAWPGYEQCCVEWIGVIGDSATNKTGAGRVVISPLRRIEADEVRAFAPQLELFETKREIAQALEASWKESVKAAIKNGEPAPSKPDAAVVPAAPQPPRIIAGDATQEAYGLMLANNPKGLLVTRDELAGWLGGMDRYNSGGERAFWLEANCGGSYVIDRKSSGSLVIKHLAVAIFGGLQPDRFAALVADGDDDGLAGRFLWVWPDPRPFARPKQWADEGVIIEAFKRLRSLEMAEGNDGPVPVVVPLTDGAANIFESWCREDQHAFRDGGALFRSWRGKGRGHVLRLSLVLEHLEWAFAGTGSFPAAVGEEAVIKAIAFYQDYFLPMAQRVFGDAVLGEAEKDAGAVARWIVNEERQRFTLKDIYWPRIGGVSKADRAERAVQVLIDANWLEAAPSRSGDTPGRHARAYRVNGELWDALNE